MKLVVWLALCLILCLALRRRPDLTVAIGLGVWVAVPGVASGLITGISGGSLGFHAGSWLLLVGFFVQVLNDPVALLQTLARRAFSFTGVLLVLAAAVLQTKSGIVDSGVVLAVNEMAAPFLAFWVLFTALDAHPLRAASTLRTTIVALGAVESAFAIVQYTLGSPVLFESDYAKQYWWRPDITRWMGTTDHPLVLSLLVCAAIPLLVGLRRRWLQPPLLALMLVAVVITQSRSGAVAAAIAAIYVVLASNSSAARKIALSLAMALIGALVATSSLSSGIVDRIQDDTGSALARGSAWTYFADSWTQYLFAGGGLTSNYRVAADAGLDTSFESAFIMYSIDLGLLLTVLYFVLMAVLAFSGRTGRLPGARMSALAVLLLCQTFNSLEVSTLVGPLLWVVLALATSPPPDAGDTSAGGEDTKRKPVSPLVPARPGHRFVTSSRRSAAV